MKIKIPFLKIFILAAFLLRFGVVLAQDYRQAPKGMQNLTAHYNILFNARELIKESEEDFRLAYPNNYSRLIPVFTEPDGKSKTEDKNLNEAILKANTIANEKSKSNYVDDAYLLIGIANHWKADFYNAVEFFDYVYQNYPKEKGIRQAALVWKGRSLMQLKRFEDAGAALDTAIKYIKNSKKTATEIYAAKAQWHIYAKEYPLAEELLGKAIKSSKNKKQRIYWTYLRAELEELNGKTADAYKHYTAVVKSNAPFEMAFNANLNRISIEEQQEGAKVNREQRLRALLKDEKNLELADQIYYHIALNFEKVKELDKAIANYNLSLRKNTRNQDQRGLAYLALADIYFRRADYVNAKKYYDSTLVALPTSHPDWEPISKKNNSLDLLTKNLIVIAEEDTLQMLAALPEAEQKAKIDEMVSKKLVQAEATKSQSETAGNFGNNPTYDQVGNAAANTKFYFNNPVALSQGFSDFKKRWGTRKLEDNWRISQKSSGQLDDPSAVAEVQTTAIANNEKVNKPNSSAEDLKNEYLFKLPNTPDKVLASDLRIADAYFEVGNYYREVLNDKPEAIAAFETLNKRFPNYINRAAVYYNLYRLYAESDSAKSNYFKTKILNELPNSVFAKVILDPEFGQKQDEQDLALGRFYDQTFEQFAKKNYKEVLNCIREMNAAFGTNRLSAQIAYLSAISAGHQQNLAPFENSLKAIANHFPDDKLITPLVKQHLAFIDENRRKMALRLVVLVDNDPISFAMLEKPEISLATNTPENKTVTAEPDTVIAEPSAEIKPEVVASDSIFDLNNSNQYYVVVNVADASVNLSSSRFSIGQFNRANFPGGKIKHQLALVENENQLIFIGEFPNRDLAYEYLRDITPVMGEIMKVPAEKYTLFMITKANLDRITTIQTLNSYREFYQKHY